MAGQDFAFSGVYAAALTPLTDDLDPDIGLMAAHCRWLLDNGCDGLAILGTTGEANSFGLKERIGILDGLAEAGIPGERLLPGTGSCALPDAIQLSKAAIDNGVRKVDVLCKGPGAGRETAIRTLAAAGIEVLSIRDITPVPHNGCRPPKRRRV